MKFEDLNISKQVIENLNDEGITEPTQVQQKSIPKVLEGKDLLVESETGSGKTLAFSLPIINQAQGNQTQALILSPTRELAKQITAEIDMASDQSIETVTIYGGVDYQPQIQGAKKANIIAGTPGRVLDLLNQGKIQTDQLEYLVLDEADRMLDMGFQDELEQIIDYLPSERQNLLFGATIPKSLKRMCDKYDIDPETIRIEQTEHTKNLEEKYIDAKRNKKLSTLYTLIEQEEDTDLSVVFCATKDTTRWLADKLKKNNLEAHELNGDMSQNQREKVVEEFENHNYKVIVATDVAARGLDIDDVTHVFNYDVPDTPDTYTHRVGRAGRQGRKGKAITLLESKDHDKFRDIKRNYDKSISRIDKDDIDFQKVNT